MRSSATRSVQGVTNSQSNKYDHAVDESFELGTHVDVVAVLRSRDDAPRQPSLGSCDGGEREFLREKET